MHPNVKRLLYVALSGEDVLWTLCTILECLPSAKSCIDNLKDSCTVTLWSSHLALSRSGIARTFAKVLRQKVAWKHKRKLRRRWRLPSMSIRTYQEVGANILYMTLLDYKQAIEPVEKKAFKYGPT